MDKNSSLTVSGTATDTLERDQHAAIASEQSSTLISNRLRQEVGPLRDFVLIWLDQNVDDKMEFYQRSLTQLRKIMLTIHLFKNTVQFLTEIRNMKKEKILLIVSGAICKSIVPQIHNMVQLDSIFIFCRNKQLHTDWTRQWSKVQCVSTKIEYICKSLRKSVKQISEDTIAMSFVPKRTAGVDSSLDQLEPSYMYTMMFKEILMELQYDEKTSVQELVTYCRDQDIRESQLDHFQQNYFSKSAIWWYTCEMFMYGMLNKSLRDLDMGIMVKMGFIIRKLFLELRDLYNQQKNNFLKSFIIYRGQGMVQDDFQHLLDIKGGLLAFNCFLSTSTERQVATKFMERNLRKYKENVGVLFHMTIDQTTVDPEQTPFAKIREFSASKQENEILFSNHTVFRVNDITQSDKNKKQWDVQLILTDDNDPQLGGLVNYLKKEIGGTGWFRMAQLMLKVGDFEQADGLYNQLLEDPANERERALIYHQLGEVRRQQGRYKEQIEYCEKSLEIKRKTAKEDDPNISATYNNIALAYRNMGEYSRALEYYEKSLKMREKTLPPTHPDLATSYNNIGLVYEDIGEYSRALEYYQKSLKIREKTLPPTHPDLAISYNSIGKVYYNLGEYSKALEYYEKDLEITKRALPPTHPDLATSCNNIGGVCYNRGEYSKALEYYEKSLKIREQALPPSHPDLANSYNNIGKVYYNMGEYSKALEYCGKSLKIREKALPPTHPDLANSYKNIGSVYDNMGEHSKALEYHEKSMKIYENVLPSTHPDLAASYNNIGSVYDSIGEYSKALEYYEKDLEIIKKALPPTHPDLATSYSNIGGVYSSMGEYSKALEYYEKSLKIREQALPLSHPNLATSYNNIGLVYYDTGEYSKAISFLEKGLSILQNSLPPAHENIKAAMDNIAIVKGEM